jgi:hypothetical protein
LSQCRVGPKAAMAVAIGTQRLGQHSGIRLIRPGATASPTGAVAVRRLRWNQIHHLVSVQQIVNQQVVAGLDGYQTVGRRHAQFAPSQIELFEALYGVLEFEFTDGGAEFTLNAQIVMVLTPVNAEIEHVSPPWVHGPSEHADDCVPIIALAARHAFDSAVRLARGDSPQVALAALEYRGPLSRASLRWGKIGKWLLTPCNLPHRLIPGKYS